MTAVIVLCRSKSDFDYKAAKESSKNLRRNFLGKQRMAYKHIKPQIIAEQFMVDESGTELKDYSFSVLTVFVKAMFIGSERGSADGTKFDFTLILIGCLSGNTMKTHPRSFKKRTTNRW